MLTTDQQADICRRYQAGDSVRALARTFERDPVTIRRCVTRNGLALRGRPSTPYPAPKLELVRRSLTYDPATGILRWRKNEARGGWVNRDGYISIRVCGYEYPAHRIAWFLHYGEWPTLEIDHANRVRSDNRIENLRLATKAQNRINCPKQGKHRFKGVSFAKGRWLARIKVNGANRHLGSFKTEEEAAAAYRAVAKKVFGEFAA